jgi:hypothetical protein
VQILKDSGYHSEEWEETDPESVEENDNEIEGNSKEKTMSIYVYERWWRSSAVCI